LKASGEFIRSSVAALDTAFINSVPWPGKSRPDAMKMSCRQGYSHARLGIFSEVAGGVDCSRALKFTRGASRGIMDR
jgi:hypothetical protein